MVDSARLGAYGLTIRGLEEQRHLLSPTPAAWPELRLHWAPRGPTVPGLFIDSARAVYPQDVSGHVIVDRLAGTATWVTPDPPPVEDLVHPRLGFVAAVFAQWLGDDSFHAGAFVHGGCTWAVVGEAEHGKSTLLAALHASGLPVVADDTLVIRDGLCLTGSRCLDLRVDTPDALGLRNSVTPARGGSRGRLPLGPPPPPAPLGGFLFLRWAHEVALEPVPVPERPPLVGGLRGWHRRGAASPMRLLELAALPAWTLTRPRDWKRVPEVVELLGDALADTGQPGPLEKEGALERRTV